MIHTVKGFGIVNKAEIDVFLEVSCFFHDPADVSNLISGSTAFSKTSMNRGNIVVHTVKGFGIVNKAEIDVFLGLSCFLDGSTDVGNLISGSSAFSKTRFNIWKFRVHVFAEAWLGEF